MQCELPLDKTRYPLADKAPTQARHDMYNEKAYYANELGSQCVDWSVQDTKQKPKTAAEKAFEQLSDM